VHDSIQSQPLDHKLPPVDTIEPLDYKKCLKELDKECQRMEKLWPIRAIDVTTSQMDQPTPTPPKNPPRNQKTTTRFQSLDGSLPLVDAVEPFEYKLCLIVLEGECRQMAQQWPILDTNEDRSQTEQLMPPASPQNPPHTQQTITDLKPLGDNLPPAAAIEPSQYKPLLHELDEVHQWLTQRRLTNWPPLIVPLAPQPCPQHTKPHFAPNDATLHPAADTQINSPTEHIPFDKACLQMEQPKSPATPKQPIQNQHTTTHISPPDGNLLHVAAVQHYEHKA